MVATTIYRWGTPSQKTCWLEKIASGKVIGAFALTEPEAGSDVMNLRTTVTRDSNSYILNGTKTWITVGQIADIFLVFAQYEDQYCAFLVKRDTPGLSMEPIKGMLGVRGSQLGQLNLSGCRLPEDSLVGTIGFGFSAVAAQALNLGRYSIAWGCVGMAQDCLEASIRHTSARKQFGVFLKEHQLVQKMIADMHVNINAARLLCHQAAHAEESNMPDAYTKTLIAKYFASRMASQVTSDAVQIHGALGCSTANPVQRHMRDAKIMEIIEGTTQIHQIKIAEHAFQEFIDE
jgi:alkylation response protein AidB-like acyl-CoA dehydrogenase